MEKCQPLDLSAVKIGIIPSMPGALGLGHLGTAHPPNPMLTDGHTYTAGLHQYPGRNLGQGSRLSPTGAWLCVLPQVTSFPLSTHYAPGIVIWVELE